MDARALYAAIIAGLAIVSATILGVMGQTELAIGEAGLAGSCLTFIFGLHSTPHEPGDSGYVGETSPDDLPPDVPRFINGG